MSVKVPSWELDFDVDHYALKQDRVRCPIHWCEAHRHPGEPCGDADGPFDGAHVGRVRAGRRQEATEKRRAVRLAEASGCAIEELAGVRYVLQCHEAAVESGLVLGEETRAMAEQRRARRRLGMSSSAPTNGALT